MTIKAILLSGAALCTLSIMPALASSAPHIAAAAAHPGNVHVKTALHASKATNLTSTASVATGVSVSSSFKKKTPLSATFYTFYDSGSFCNSSQKESVKLATKKTKYAKLSTGVETLTGYCSTAPTKFYGDVYDLRTKKAKNKTDTFTSTLVGKNIHYNGGLYDIKLNLDVSVAISS
jgi:hypothetical protein